jgi:hypothetical protein
MTIIEAIKTCKDFGRKGQAGRLPGLHSFHDKYKGHPNGAVLAMDEFKVQTLTVSVDELLADDWFAYEHEEKKQLSKREILDVLNKWQNDMGLYREEILKDLGFK